jgi:hypothetical protein
VFQEKLTLQDNGCVLITDRDMVACYELEDVLVGTQPYAVLKEAPSTSPKILVWYYSLDHEGRAVVWPILDPGKRGEATSLFSTGLNRNLFRAP